MTSRSLDYMAPLYRARSPRRARSFRRFAWIAVFSVGLFVILFTATRSDLARQDHRFFGTLDEDGSSRDMTPIAEAPLRSYKEEGDCSVDMQRLVEIKRRYGLGGTVQYMRRSIWFNRLPGLKRKRMTMIPHKLVPDAFDLVDFSKPQEVYKSCLSPLTVDVPVSGFPSTVDASEFIFGVSTIYSRFQDAKSSQLEDWTYWLTDGNGHSNGAKLVVTLTDAGPKELAEAADRLRKLGIKADVLASDSTANMAIRYIQLVPTINKMLDASQPYKWVVLCDDDTFFPNMHALVERFRSFDSSREMYIGTLSEDVRAVHRHGSQAFGGAGVFLSVPLVQKISRECAQGISALKKSRDLQGDMVLRECIYEKTNTRLTTVSSLWQLDLMGDPSGFYESGIKPLSLHHYRSWHEAKPGQMIKIARNCGEDCFMQRFQTSDDFILSGYSIAYYPRGIGFDTNQIEQTCRPSQDDIGWNFDHKFGPQRPALERTGRKIAWELMESKVEHDGSVSQVYIRRHADTRWVDKKGKPMSDVDGIIELVWAPSS
ncbi:hypothetical protein CP533_1136 [Ophiocordyceps camponoti-saundersi (nom. inval.)]|nr:hypothetical protein CP533_1136 [Ophiocordyceps camponoti-saundersi (nom. inval.)]